MNSFRYDKHAISVRTGGLLLIEECKHARSQKNDPNHWLTLCIEEPFDLTNTARSAYDTSIFLKIKNVFFESFCRLNQYRTLDCLFDVPFFVHEESPQYKYVPMASGFSTPLLAQMSDVTS